MRIHKVTWGFLAAALVFGAGAFFLQGSPTILTPEPEPTVADPNAPAPLQICIFQDGGVYKRGPNFVGSDCATFYKVIEQSRQVTAWLCWLSDPCFDEVNQR